MEEFSFLRSKIEKIAKENGFNNFKLTFETGSDLGFIGVLKRCRITENERELSLMCKFLPKDEEQNSKFNSFLLFEREVTIYQKLFPLFEKFQNEFGITYNDSVGFWAFPKCYFCNYNPKFPDQCIIIMEDLTVDKFEVKDKYVPSDFEHTSKLFTSLGKFHGLSLALKLKKPEEFEKFKELKNSMCFVMTTDSMKHLAPRNCRLASRLFQNERDICEKILSYEHDIWEKIGNVLDGKVSEQFSVIVHGDVWINNILYNYYSDGAIKNIKILDWQMTFYGSVGSELMYYLFCCVDKSTRDEHQEELFQLYYESMRNILSKFQYDIDKVFPYSEFQKQLKTFGLYAFGMALFAIPLLCIYPEKLFEKENANLTDVEQECLKHYNRRMRDIILDMINMEIL